MVVKRCPQCHSTTDDKYGFCIKCGYEFSKDDISEHVCPLCGFKNPDEATFCVKCGTPLIFKRHNITEVSPIVIRQERNSHTTSRFLILLGYIFALLGGVVGLIIAIYLATRSDPIAKKHGYIQLAILIFYIILIAVLFATGNIPQDALNNYQELLNGNFTMLNTLQ